MSIQADIRAKALRNCIATIGEEGFFDAYFRLLHGIALVDQCMIFRYGDGVVRCLLSRNFGSVVKGNSAAQKYLSEGFRDDPLLAHIDQLKENEAATLWGKECREDMAPAYRKAFFDKVGLLDKTAVLLRQGGDAYCVNFYRKTGCITFDMPGEPDKHFWTILAQICLTHLRLTAVADGLGPLAILSEKERQICSGILQGRKTEQIAADCGIAHSTAITYRRRAYAKLGISSRTALFVVCGKG